MGGCVDGMSGQGCEQDGVWGLGWSGVNWVGKGDIGWGGDVKSGWVVIGVKL